ncbi:MAG: AraC family transcriptional regulator [Bacteroidales bacterium]|nr:AraC family transcriptional regulator [Bacteroidales bacterium]
MLECLYYKEVMHSLMTAAFYEVSIIVERNMKFGRGLQFQQKDLIFRRFLELIAVSEALRFSDRSIKEIAVDFGFTNLSTFGKFVKDNLGDSPRAFRRAKVC